MTMPDVGPWLRRKLEHRANGGAAFGDLPAAEASAQPPSLSNVKAPGPKPTRTARPHARVDAHALGA